MTATPPYDSNRSEWDRYISVCGEIDDEIFVPELVKTGDLCCHQDYIYFNYPSADELDIIEGHNRRVDDFLDELSEEGIIHSLATENFIFKDPDKYLDICFDDEENFVGFLKLLDLADEYIPDDIEAMFLNHHTKIKFDTGLQFVYDHSELFPEKIHETVIDKLKKFKLIERNRVRITSDIKINRLMLQSVGKMESIRAICNAEFDNLGNDLRMLILGDYIRKDYLSDIGTNNPFTQIGIVPIFETIRRSMGTEVKVGVLTGSLVILPEKSLREIGAIVKDRGYKLNYSELIDGYVMIDSFSHSSRMVNLVTEAFQRGHIEILIVI